MAEKNFEIKNVALKMGESGKDAVNFLLMLFVVFILLLVCWTKHEFGDVSLPQLLFFLMYDGSSGVDLRVVLEAVGVVVCLPIIITCGVFYFCKKKYNGKVLFYNEWFVLTGMVLLALLVWVAKKRHFIEFDDNNYEFFLIVLFGFYLLNLWRNFNRANLFVCGVLGVFFVFTSSYCSGIMGSLYNFSETNFYQENYKFVKNIKIDEEKRRNVIVIFVESFENKYANAVRDGKKFEVMDDEAISFFNLTEGFSQNWTQGALFSLFTGVHIHYLSDFFRYRVKSFKFDNNQRLLLQTNNLGEKFNFDTPNIRYLGDIAKANGYNNLFVQGGKLKFSGTDKFLFNHGFDKKNVFDAEEYKGTKEYDKALFWWGVKDKLVFQKFKKELVRLDKEKPFLAVMFTLDLHKGESPFFKNEEDEAVETISNLNDFIKWYKEQDWNKNTTLILIGDHKRMGTKVEIGGDIYNAFFNVPERLKEGIDLKREFEQIDMFPTILDIMGVELEDGRAGVGVSLFSKNKTIAERYQYNKQKEMFSKIDRFYQKIWEEKSSIWGRELADIEAKEKFIAHAGGVIDGNAYTNSLEALEKSKQRGYKYIELDMVVGGVLKDKIIATHDCDRFYKMSSKRCGENIDFEKDKLLGKYSILDDERILKFFSKNEDMWLVTDKIDDFYLLDKKFGKIKERMFVEVFCYKKYLEAMGFGFMNVALNVKNKADVKEVLKNKVNMVTMSLEFAKNNESDVLSLNNNGVKILGYTAKNFDDVRKFEGKIDMFYYDGEEEIDTYIR